MKKQLYPYLRYIVHNFYISVLLIVFLEILARHSVVSGVHFVWNHPFLTLYSGLLLTTFYSMALLFPKRNLAWLWITAIILGLGVTNGILLCFRITPLAVTDILVIPSVLEIMTFYLSWWQIFLIVLVICTAVGGIIYFGSRMKKQDYSFKIAFAVVLSLAAISTTLMNIGDATGMLQTKFANLPDAYEDNGFVYCFTRSLFDRGIEKPETYSEETVDDILSDIKSKDTNMVSHKPNLIFLQLESFIDLHRLEGITYSANPIPIYADLLESCQSGYLTVPSVGAGTVNTEFEILTGMSIQYFGAGEYPYKTVLQNETCESLAYNLKELDYHTTAIHNNTGTFYDRNNVYANLGFDNFSSIEYMKNITYNSIGWAKDNILTGQIMDALHSSGEQDFIYAVSVQDHGKYPVEKMEDAHIQVSGFSPQEEEQKNAFEYYVNQVHETDAFLGYLVSILNAYEEPVVLVMFGDHLPNINLTDEDLSSGNRFQTEYVLWANKAAEKFVTFEKEEKDLYGYQLSAYVLEKLGINNGILTKFHQSYSEIENYEQELETLQYDMLYGEREVYDGVSPYKPTELQMGIEPVTIKEVSCVGDTVYVVGENFTQSSQVYRNGKVQETGYLSENTLMITETELEEEDRIFVAQTAGLGEILSQTEEYIYHE